MKMVVGGDEMRTLAKICVSAVVCLGMTGGGWARDHSHGNRPPAGPFRPGAVLSVPKTPLRFGEVSGPGPKRLRAEVTARVMANCPFRVAASFQGLTQRADRTVVIPSGQITVTINGRNVPVGTNRVVIAGGGPTPPGGVNVLVAVEMEIKGASLCQAGRYGGNLTLTTLTGP
jgi:hypothetical protein